eukprot:6670385-Prymnesium_polylepis.2
MARRTLQKVVIRHTQLRWLHPHIGLELLFAHRQCFSVLPVKPALAAHTRLVWHLMCYSAERLPRREGYQTLARQ